MNRCAEAAKFVEPFGIGIGHIDAAVAHRLPEVVVPVGAMERISLIEKHDPFDVIQIVIGSGHPL